VVFSLLTEALGENEVLKYKKSITPIAQKSEIINAKKEK
jgi:hypothetical protein